MLFDDEVISVFKTSLTNAKSMFDHLSADILRLLIHLVRIEWPGFEVARIGLNLVVQIVGYT